MKSLIDSAIRRVNYKIGFVSSGPVYRELNRQLSKLVEYKKELDKCDRKDYKEYNRICRNFKGFCYRNDINYI